MRDPPCNSQEASTEDTVGQTFEIDDDQKTFSDIDHSLSDEDRQRNESGSDQVRHTQDAVKPVELLRALMSETNFEEVTFRESNEQLQVLVNYSDEIDLEPIKQSIGAIEIDDVEYSCEITTEGLLRICTDTSKVYHVEKLKEWSEETLQDEMDETKNWIKEQDALKPM